MRYKIFCFLLLGSNFLYAQDIAYNRKIVDTLASPYFWGRGYTKNGMQRAADFLAKEFAQLGIKPMGNKNYLQKFTFSANTFPNKMEVEINNKKLVPGVDFIVTANSRGRKGYANLVRKDSVSFADEGKNILVTYEKKLTWSVEQEAENITHIQIDKNRFTEIPITLNFFIENKIVDNFTAANVCGLVQGTQQPDSFIFITAHYDHLGGMGGDTYFPGANDNASGVALLLSLAKYYAAHPQKYSIGFILFAAEEIGLLGSKYFTENPLIPLNKIKFLTNTDLAGTGIDGITVVNATMYPKEFSLMQKINSENMFLKTINPRGKAANSDHYWFSEKGVPSFFFYTLGGISAYHDVYDVAATLPLTEQEDLQTLIILFNLALQQ